MEGLDAGEREVRFHDISKEGGNISESVCWRDQTGGLCDDP